MKTTLVITAITQAVGSETLKLAPPKPDTQSAVMVTQGSSLGLKITDPKLFGQFKPGQTVTFTLD